MKRFFVFAGILSSIALAGCAAKVVAGNERTAIIDAHPSDPAGALILAQKECQKRGLQARLNTRPLGDRLWVFDCIN